MVLCLKRLKNFGEAKKFGVSEKGLVIKKIWGFSKNKQVLELKTSFSQPAVVKVIDQFE